MEYFLHHTFNLLFSFEDIMAVIFLTLTSGNQSSEKLDTLIKVK